MTTNYLLEIKILELQNLILNKKGIVVIAEADLITYGKQQGDILGYLDNIDMEINKIKSEVKELINDNH
jgi:hypothetical protein